MTDQLSPEQRAELILKDSGVWLNCWEFHSIAKDIASAIRAAVQAERARWIKAATDVARDATAAGNEHAAAGALAVVQRMEATHG